MNTMIGLPIKLIALTVLVLIAMMLGACSKPNEASTAQVLSVAKDKNRPAKMAKAYVYDGGMCNIDSSNPPAVSNLIAASKKVPLGLYGWAVPDSTGRPLPPTIFAVLSGDHDIYYLEGKRLPRPDVAKGNHFLDLAGFEVTGSLANMPAGEYKLGIVTGTEFVVAVCQTKMVVRISE